MYSTTGLHPQQFLDLFWKIFQSHTTPTWPSSLGLRTSLTIALIYLRRNRVQDDLAETYNVSQPTISRAISALIPLVKEATIEYTPTAEDLGDTEFYIVDGTLLPCWSWAHTRELWSGKHKTTGYNVQIVVDLDGTIVWISDPVTGNHHDVYGLNASGVLDTVDPSRWLGDKGYIGTGIYTPIRKPADRGLTDEEEAFNTSVNTIRWTVEKAIANLKTWRIFHTDFRKPLKTFTETISTVIVIGLYFFSTAE